MRLLVALASLTCLSFVKPDTPTNFEDVPIERPPIANTEIPPSDIIPRRDPNIVIRDEEPPPRRQAAPNIFERIGKDDMSPKELETYLNTLINTIGKEINQNNLDGPLNPPATPRESLVLPPPPGGQIGLPSPLGRPIELPPPSGESINLPPRQVEPTMQNLPPIGDLNLPSGQRVDFERQIDNAINDLIKSQPTPSELAVATAIQNSERDFRNLGQQLNTLEDLNTVSTVDNFDSDDAKKLVQLIEERRELLRQISEREQISSMANNGPNLNGAFARSASFRTTDRLSDNFDDFGIPRIRTPSVLTPLMGNSIGVPTNIVTDAESLRNNQPSNLLADAGRVNAPATIRERFPDNVPGGRPNLLGSLRGLNLEPGIPFDNNIIQGPDDDSELTQRRNNLIRQRQLLEAQLVRVSRDDGQALLPIAPAMPMPLGQSPGTGTIRTGPVLFARGLNNDNRLPRLGINTGDDRFSLSNLNQNSFSTSIPNATPFFRQTPFLPLSANDDDDLSGFRPSTTGTGRQSPFSLNLFNRGSFSPDLDDGLLSQRETNRLGIPQLTSASNSVRINSRFPVQIRNPSPGFLGRSAPGAVFPTPFGNTFNRGAGFSPSLDDLDDRPSTVNSLSAFQGFLSSLEDFRNRPGISGFSSSVRPVRPGLVNPVSRPPPNIGRSVFWQAGTPSLTQVSATPPPPPPLIDDDRDSTFGLNENARQTLPPQRSQTGLIGLLPSSQLVNDERNVFRGFNARQTLGSDDDRQTGPIGVFSQSLDDFPDFNKQVEALFQSTPGFSSVTFGGSNAGGLPPSRFFRSPSAPRSFDFNRMGQVF
uniref:Uncharacterized protein LOC111111063 n=1 Tax=Crassostrea virginica TaxID=6565 RepID=A0A8B8BJK4_CRAVI|nr:uncharacterized protein LOC111111063 [Crassostrea virginica]